MKVLITQNIPSVGIELLLKAGYEVNVLKKTIVSDIDIIKNAKDADAILTLLTNKISDKVINNLQKVRVISNYAVGYNNIDVKAATKKNIVVTNTPGVLTDATADLTMALVLATSRRIVESDRFMRAGKFRGWEPMLMLGLDLKGKAMGILGAGRIGEAVARRAHAFGMKIIYSSITDNSLIETDLKAKRVSLSHLLRNSDVLSLHVPLTPETFHILDQKSLQMMKSSSILINTARGEVVDEEYLIELLEKKKIFAAGFDVYEGEPVIRKKLLNLKNVVVLPHIGSATVETRDKMARIAAKNIIEVLSGRKPKFAVNPEVFNKK